MENINNNDINGGSDINSGETIDPGTSEVNASAGSGGSPDMSSESILGPAVHANPEVASAVAQVFSSLAVQLENAISGAIPESHAVRPGAKVRQTARKARATVQDKVSASPARKPSHITITPRVPSPAAADAAALEASADTGEKRGRGRPKLSHEELVKRGYRMITEYGIEVRALNKTKSGDFVPGRVLEQRLGGTEEGAMQHFNREIRLARGAGDKRQITLVRRDFYRLERPRTQVDRDETITAVKAVRLGVGKGRWVDSGRAAA